jgi:hypothetical protein
MRVYLDNCCFNRPFDDQSQVRIRLETEAKLEIQQRIRDHRLELAWSYILDYENQANPFPDRLAAIASWRNQATVDLEESAMILQQARGVVACGLSAKDALHIACAIVSQCEYFLTTDDLVIKSMRGFAGITVMNPTQFVIEVL